MREDERKKEGQVAIDVVFETSQARKLAFMREVRKGRDKQVPFGLLNETTSVHSVDECSYRHRDCSCISTNEIIIRTPIRSSL